MNRTSGTGIFLLAMSMALPGCGPDDSARDPRTPLTVDVSPAATTMLARADAMDGTADHVVSLCSGCGLGMQGDAAYTLEAGEFSMHFCSDSCLDHFAEHTEEAIAALDLPDGEIPDATR
jgi:hypothetical protein